MRLGPFILRRLALSIFVLFGLSILIFIIARIVPGDPARLTLGPRAPVYVVERLRQQMHLDKPLHQQYGLWLWEVAHGNLGNSLLTRRPFKRLSTVYIPVIVGGGMTPSVNLP